MICVYGYQSFLWGEVFTYESNKYESKGGENLNKWNIPPHVKICIQVVDVWKRIREFWNTPARESTEMILMGKGERSFYDHSRPFALLLEVCIFLNI